jgi:hypothetical protein
MSLQVTDCSHDADQPASQPMESKWAVSHTSQKAIPRSSQACPEPEQETR